VRRILESIAWTGLLCVWLASVLFAFQAAVTRDFIGSFFLLCLFLTTTGLIWLCASGEPHD
jgi:MFS-type transporter involved in bile tolerance (Atg22 family)